MNSSNAVCLLSDGEVKVNLRGYSAELDLLDYKLDKECAAVVVSNQLTDNSGKTWFVVEHLHKIPPVDTDTVRTSFKIENEMSCVPHEDLDLKRIQELIESGRVKRAKTLEAYPSDAGC